MISAPVALRSLVMSRDVRTFLSALMFFIFLTSLTYILIELKVDPEPFETFSWGLLMASIPIALLPIVFSLIWHGTFSNKSAAETSIRTDY